MLRVFALAFLCVAAAPPEDLLEREQQRLKGTWRVVSVEVGGLPVPPREYRDLTLTFRAGKFTARRGEEQPQEGNYTLGPARTPKEMDITRTNGPVEGRKQLAIYQVTGGSLRICSCAADAERPSSFDTREQPGWTLMTLRRAP
jgi:uncharacterized protein (TIGR03067 family)